MRRSGITAATALALALLAAGCGSSHGVPGDRIAGHRLTVFLSLPLHGPSAPDAQAVVGGAELALGGASGHVGRLRIVLRALDDSLPARDGWDPGQTAANARLAAADATTIGYIGEFNSGATAISIPELNRLGIAQISPAASAVGLTTGGPGAEPGEPDKYYPSGIRTFARLVPSDAVQASIQVALQQRLGCTKTYVVDDGEVDGQDMAGTFELVARAAGLDVVGVQNYEPGAADYTSFAASVAQSGAGCVMMSAVGDTSAALVMRQIAEAMPHAKLFGSAGVADADFVDPSRGGLPPSVASRLLITVAPLPPAQLPPVGRTVLATYARHYGSSSPWALYGYEAMSLMLAAIARSTDHGEDPARRSKVVQALFGVRDRTGAIGTYSLDSHGDTTMRSYTIDRVVDGRLRPWTVFDG